MRIGILTFPNSSSFGAALQMYALYKALEKMGCEVEIINYQNTFMAKKKHITHRTKNCFLRIAIALLDTPGKNSFRKFEKQLTFFPNAILSEKDDLQQIENRYDYLVCGSDQVWNPNITGEDLYYFFSFCKDNEKKISYAASFGVNELSQTFAQAVKEQLEKFKNISVREEQGAKIVHNLVRKDCSVVLDPTMLISQEEWRLCEKKPDGLPNRYIAKFVFNNDSSVEAKIKELAEKTGLPVLTVGGTVMSKLRKELCTGPIGPSEWLYVLDHADYVVTDSFHGTAFSIIFHKNVLVSLASSTNSRLITLLHTFGLDDRAIGETLQEDSIDYKGVQRIMNKSKEYSLDFLRKAMGIGDEAWVE